MQTVYDWLSVAIFAGLAILYLQRSVAETQVDSVWQYLPPAIGCAVADQLGNHEYPIPAALLLAGSMAYIFYVLKPFTTTP